MSDLILYAVTSFAIAFLGTLVGLVLGVVRLPLIYMIGLSPGVAAGTNVGVTAVSSLVGGWQHFREGRLDRRLLVTIGIPSVIGSFAGGFLGSVIPAWVILAAVAVAVLWQGAVFLIQGRRESREGDGGGSQIPTPRRNLPLEIALGMGIGFLGSLVGLALGIIRLPAMVQLLRVYPPIAVGTNLAINFVSALFAIVGRLSFGQVDYTALGVMGLAAGVGAYFGARTTGRISQASLSTLIGAVLALVSVLVLYQAIQEFRS